MSMRLLIVILFASCNVHRDEPPAAGDACDRARATRLRPTYEVVGPESSTIGDTFVVANELIVTGDTNEAADRVDWDYGVVRIRSFAAGRLREEAVLTNEHAEHPARLGAALAVAGERMFASDGLRVFSIAKQRGRWTKAPLFDIERDDELIERMASAGDALAIATSNHKVLIYEPDGATWRRVFALPTDDFHTVVAASGDVVVVGEPEHSRVRVVRRRAAGWKIDEELHPTPGEPPGFGANLAIDGDLVVVASSYGHAVDIIRLQSGGRILTTVRSPLPVPDFATFGASLALAGRLLAVGTNDLQTVQLFRETRGAWQPIGEAPAPRAYADHPSFGAHIELGPTMWVGAQAVTTRKSYPGAVLGYDLGDLATCQASSRSRAILAAR